MKRFLIRLGVIAAALLAPATAFADPPTLSVSVEPGIAVPLTSPQSDRFKVGGDVAVRPFIGLTPWLAVGPNASVLALPSDVPGVDAGTAWGFGAGARLRRPQGNSSTGLTAVSPWIDADAQYIRTGPLDRFGYSVGAGATLPITSDRTLSVGPFVRYASVFQDTKVGFDTADGRFLIAGLTVEFGTSPVKKAEQPKAPPPPKQPPKAETPKEQPKPTPKPAPTPDPVTFELKERVPFNVDSAVILPSAKPIIAHVVDVLKRHDGWSLQIEGHASSEGPPEPYNQKLSERRAQAVLDALIAAGLPAERMTAKGFSYSRPVADNKTEATRAPNRRVEFNVTFVIVKKEGAK